jgi:hypothetical protein
MKRFGILGYACLILLLSLHITTFASTVPSDDEMPVALFDALVALLENKVAKIDSELTKDGLPYERASFSKNFIKSGDDRYQVSFTKDAPGEGRARTDRYLLTIAKAGKKWEVTDELLQDSFDGMVRDVAGDEQFYSFDKFTIDKEGMRITASGGTLFTDSLLGVVDLIRFSAADLKYEYKPPAGLSDYHVSLYEYLKQARPDDFSFTPELATLSCDPATCQDLLFRHFSGLSEIDQESLGPVLQESLEEMLRTKQEARKENKFSGFSYPRSEHRRYALRVDSADGKQWLSLRYSNEHTHEVRLIAPEYGTIFGYSSEITRQNTSPYEIERREDTNALDFQLTSLVGSVDLALIDSELLEADIEFTLEIKRKLDVLPFYFNDWSGIYGGKRSTDRNPAITINSIQTADGEELTWVRRGASGGLVILPEEVPAGATLVLRMQFSNSGSIIKVSPSYSRMDRGGWLPFVRFTDKIEHFDLTVRTPARYKALGIGTKIDEQRQGKVIVTRWSGESPVRFPTIIFGDYVEDFPKTKAEKNDGTQIPIMIYVDKESMTDWGIRPKQLRPLAEQAVNAINIYRTLFGVDYPYGKLDLVNDPWGFLGAQAPASIVYLGSGIFRSTGTLTNAVINSGGIAEHKKTVVAHEVAHQWWGALIGNSSQTNYWFIESLAEYSSALFLEIIESEGYKYPKKGQDAYLAKVEAWRKDVVRSNLLSSVQDAPTLWSNNGYRALLYSKGPYAFHMLRVTFGDQKFFAFLKTLAQQLAGTDIVSRDIQLVAESALGGVTPEGEPYSIDLEWFFDQWIRGLGIPQFRFAYSTRQAEDGAYIVEGTIQQEVFVGAKGRRLPGVYYRGIVPITVRGKGQMEYPAKVVVEGPETEFQFKVPEEPREVTLNKYGELLAYDVLMEN